MGYTTDFEGTFKLGKPLLPQHATYLARFSGTRRMMRDAAKTAKRADPEREAAGLPVGPNGAYFVGEGGFAGQGDFSSRPDDVTNYNDPPPGQPSLWCQWVPSLGSGNAARLASPEERCEEGVVYDHIAWDGGEKFYDYVAWLEYLIAHFLKPWGYVLNGEVTWQGEESADIGKIIVTNNQVSTKAGTIQWE
jgi:hypothetical protein